MGILELCMCAHLAIKTKESTGELCGPPLDVNSLTTRLGDYVITRIRGYAFLGQLNLEPLLVRTRNSKQVPGCVLVLLPPRL